jgi:hypothetical protein
MATLSLDVESSTPDGLANRVVLNLAQWTKRMEMFDMKPAD